MMLVHHIALLSFLLFGGINSYDTYDDSYDTHDPNKSQSRAATGRQHQKNVRKVNAFYKETTKLLTEIQSLSDQQDGIGHEYLKLASSVRDILKKFKARGSKHNVDTVEMVRAYEQQLKILRVELAAQREKMEQLKSRDEQEKDTLTKSFQAKDNVLMQDYQRLKSRITEMESISTQKSQKMAHIIESLKKELQEKSRELVKITKDDKAVHEQLDREIQDFNKKEGELNKVEKENRWNRVKLVAVKTTLAHLEAKVSYKEQQIAECQKEMTDVQTKLNTKTNEAGKLSRKAERKQRLADKLTKRVKSLTAALDAVKEQKALCEVAVNKGQTHSDDLQRKFDDINARYAKLQQVNEQQDSKIQELKAELESLQKQPAHLGERCSEANRYCVKGLGCNGSGVCAPVCGEVLAPEMVNAKVEWTQVGETYEGNINCNSDSIYTGRGSEPGKFVCNARTGQWNSEKTNGNCSKTMWTVGEIVENIKYDLPKHPEVGWAACIQGKTFPAPKDEGTRIFIVLNDAKGKPSYRFKLGGQNKFAVTAKALGRGKKYPFMKAKAEHPFVPDQTLHLKIQVTDPHTFTLYLDGRVLTKFTFAGPNVLQNVAKLQVSGYLRVNQMNLWCED